MRQLGDEIYSRPTCGYKESSTSTSSSCGGAAWLQEQLGSSYAPAWFDQLAKPNGADAAIGQAGTAGRWLNYYVRLASVDACSAHFSLSIVLLYVVDWLEAT